MQNALCNLVLGHLLQLWIFLIKRNAGLSILKKFLYPDSSMTKVRNLGKPVELAGKYYKDGANEVSFLNITGFRDFPLGDLPMLEISDVSEYDPLDLFSKSIKRVNKAVKDLFLTPQKNFRVFFNGSLIYGGLGGGPRSNSYLTAETFEDALKYVIQSDNGNRTTKFLELVAGTVFRSGLLDRLLKAQMLDMLDIEGVIHAYYNAVSHACNVCSKLRQVKEKLSERYSHIHSDPFSKSLKIVKDY